MPNLIYTYCTRVYLGHREKSNENQILCSQTPFASGPNDTPTEILHRIAESKLDLRCGTWVTISNEAKVSNA